MSNVSRIEEVEWSGSFDKEAFEVDFPCGGKVKPAASTVI